MEENEFDEQEKNLIEDDIFDMNPYEEAICDIRNDVRSIKNYISVDFFFRCAIFFVLMLLVIVIIIFGVFFLKKFT